MRIGIDGRFYGSRAKGLGRYTQKLIHYLQENDTDNDYVIFLTAENFSEFEAKNPRFQKVLANYKWYTFSEQVMMPWKIRRARLDLMHFPHFNVPLLYRGKFLVTIHDLIITHFPTVRATTLSPWLYRVKQFFYHVVIRNAVKRAQKIITVSNFSRKEIIDYFHVAAEKVVVTYEGVEKSPRKFSADDAAGLLQKLKVTKPYFLYVGTAYPHKNLEGLVRAFSLIYKQRPQFKLVLVGKKDYFYERLSQEIQEIGLSEMIVCVGEVNDEELHTLYSEAELYVFPSLCEGFGLPPLEAMLQGLPVLAAHIPCLTEILGDAAEYFDPYDVTAMAEKMLAFADDPRRKELFRDKGRMQIQKYEWNEMAQKVLKMYRQLM